MLSPQEKVSSIIIPDLSLSSVCRWELDNLEKSRLSLPPPSGHTSPFICISNTPSLLSSYNENRLANMAINTERKRKRGSSPRRKRCSETYECAKSAQILGHVVWSFLIRYLCNYAILSALHHHICISRDVQKTLLRNFGKE